MRAFFDIFQLELRTLSRSWSLAMLSAASAAWMLAVPRLVVGDGTAEGMREVCLRYGLGGITPLTQREIAAQCGISRSYVSRIEKRALQKLESALGEYRE